MANDVSGTTDETLRQEENSKDMNSNKRQLISTNFYLKMKNWGTNTNLQITQLKKYILCFQIGGSHTLAL